MPKRPWFKLGAMGDAVLDQVLLFYMGEAWAGMTDIGEVLETAHRVNVRDPTSWAREWSKTAERLDAAAQASAAAGHGKSAGELWLRAASYYRAALHRHMDPASPEVRELASREVRAFTAAMALIALPVERVAIPSKARLWPPIGIALRAMAGKSSSSPTRAAMPGPRTISISGGRLFAAATAASSSTVPDRAPRSASRASPSAPTGSE
jgi:hypothetical protein